MEVDFRNGNGKINADSESRGAGEQANEDEEPAEELGEGGKIGGPGGKSEAGNEVSMLLKSAEDLVISVSDHDGAKRKAHEKKCEGLQSIEVAQAMPPEKENIDYSRHVSEGNDRFGIEHQPEFGASRGVLAKIGGNSLVRHPWNHLHERQSSDNVFSPRDTGFRWCLVTSGFVDLAGLPYLA